MIEIRDGRIVSDVGSGDVKQPASDTYRRNVITSYSIHYTKLYDNAEWSETYNNAADEGTYFDDLDPEELMLDLIRNNFV